MDEEGVEVFEVREADELGGVGVVAEVAFLAGVGIAPSFGRHAEEGHVEDVGLAGVDEVDLCFVELGRDEIGLDGVGVDAVVDLGEVAFDVSAELLAFLLFEALELLDEVELELDGDPGGEFEGDVGMGVGAAVAAGP